jgi:hypothetical protein
VRATRRSVAARARGEGAALKRSGMQAFGGFDAAHLVRSVLSAALEIAGMLVALRAIHRRTTRKRRAAKASADSLAARALANDLSRAGGPAVTHCIHCGRSFRDVETLGCGGTDRKGKCPARRI